MFTCRTYYRVHIRRVLGIERLNEEDSRTEVLIEIWVLNPRDEIGKWEISDKSYLLTEF